MGQNYRIDYLKNHSHYIPLLASWHQQQWRHLNPPQYDIQQRRNEYLQACQLDDIPLMLIAHDGQDVLGSVRIIVDDMETHPQWSPWLASLFVAEPYRRQGIAQALITRALQEAGRLGYARLYLFTEDQQLYYQRLGWQVIMHESYYDENVYVMRRNTV